MRQKRVLFSELISFYINNSVKCNKTKNRVVRQFDKETMISLLLHTFFLKKMSFRNNKNLII